MPGIRYSPHSSARYRTTIGNTHVTRRSLYEICPSPSSGDVTRRLAGFVLPAVDR